MANYVSPQWQNDQVPKLNAANMQAITDQVEKNQVLSGSGAPGSGTSGALGQRYADTSTAPPTMYECTDDTENAWVWTPVISRTDLAEKANIDGSYDGMTVGNAEQLVSTNLVQDTAPYLFRPSGGNMDIGNRAYDAIVGGTLAWNQLVRNGNFASGTANWYRGTNDTESQQHTTIAAENGVITVTHNEETSVLGFKWGLSQSLQRPMVPGHKYYVAFDIRVSHPVQIFTLLGTVASYGIINVTDTETWVSYRKILEAPVTGAPTFFCISGAALNAYVPIPQGTTREFRNVQLVDLTLLFGPVIADWLYTTERENTGTGTGWLNSRFPKNYYEHNNGELLSVNAGNHITVGFNAYDMATGTARLLGGNQYQITGSYTDLSYTDVNGNAETILPDAEGLFTPAADGTLTVTGGSSADTCVHLTWSGYRNGEYEPYESHTYPLDSSLTLRGVPTLDSSNELSYDGDQYAADGTVTRRYGIVDMGTLTYSYLSDERSNRFSVGVPGMKLAVGAKPGSIITSGYANYGYNDVMYGRVDKGIAVNSIYRTCAIVDSTYSDDAAYPTTAEKTAALKASLSGVYLVFELDTPATETADTFQRPQIVDDFGTEEYVDAAYAAGDRDVAIPVGHITDYPANLRDKLQNLPGTASTDGDYIIRQVGKSMTLIPETAGSRIDALAAEMDEGFSDTNRMEVLAWTHDNAYIGTSSTTADVTNPTSYEGFRCAVIDCQPGDLFTVNVSGGVTPRAWAFLDGSGSVLTRADSSGTTPNYRGFILRAPANAATLVLNDRYSGLDSYSGVYAGAAIQETGLMHPPLTNGTYVLKATVNNGTVTYAWAAES